MVTGWKFINNYWYHFKSDGAMTTGWLLDGDTWYYLNEDLNCQPIGSMLQNHWKDNYYLKDGGAMAAGETVAIGGKEYRFAADGQTY